MDRQDVLTAFLKPSLQILKLGAKSVSEVPVLGDLAEGVVEEVAEKIGPHLKNYKNQIPNLVETQMAGKSQELQNFVLAAAEFCVDELTADSLIEGRHYEAWASAVERAESYAEVQKHLSDEERAALRNDLPMVLAQIIEQIQVDCLEDKNFLNRVLGRLSDQVNAVADQVESQEKRLDDHDQRLGKLEAGKPGLSPRMKEKLSDFTPARNAFVYNAEKIGFYGRSAQMDQLKKFCAADGKILFWAVTGAGGSGKSRLAYEFAKEMVQGDWKVRVLKKDDYEHLDREFPEGNTLYLADYVQGHLEQLGSWICALEDSAEDLSGKVRILILERDGAAVCDSGWMDQMKQAISGFGSDFSADCYSDQWLQLEPMGKPELQETMNDYSQRQKEKALSEQEQEYLYDALLQVDETLRRPLFALFITDAFIRGETPQKWDQKSTLDVLYQKERSILKANILGVSPNYNVDQIWPHLARVYAAVTLYGETSVEKIQKVFPQIWGNFLSTLPEPREDTAWELLAELGILDRDSEKLHPLEPDLFGEHFVLCQLEDKNCRSLIKKELAANFHERSVLIFLDRIRNDYPERLKKLDWLIQALLDTKYTPEEWKTSIPILHNIILVNLTAVQTVEEREKIVAIIRGLHESHLDISEVTAAYAESMFNLSSDQMGEECANTIEKLRKLHEENRLNGEVTVSYAKALVNSVYNNQIVSECEQVVQMLHKLHVENPLSSDVTVQYAWSLANLCGEQTITECEKTVDLVRKLHETNLENDEMMMAFAMAMFNWEIYAITSMPEKLPYIFERVKSICDEYPEIGKSTETDPMDEDWRMQFAQKQKEKLQQIAAILRNDYPENKNIPIAEELISKL